MADLAVRPSLDFGGFCALLSISSAFTVLLRYLQFSSINLLIEIFRERFQHLNKKEKAMF
jgi:hypothetical protein